MIPPTIITGLELALCELEALRPIGYGETPLGHNPPKLGSEAECAVKHALVDIPLLIAALKKELAK